MKHWPNLVNQLTIRPILIQKLIFWSPLYFFWSGRIVLNILEIELAFSSVKRFVLLSRPNWVILLKHSMLLISSLNLIWERIGLWYGKKMALSFTRMVFTNHKDYSGFKETTDTSISSSNTPTPTPTHIQTLLFS